MTDNQPTQPVPPGSDQPTQQMEAVPSRRDAPRTRPPERPAPQEPPPSEAQASSGNINDARLNFLMKEYDTMVSLYTQAKEAAQTVFNFYLSFITFIAGGVIVILQITPATIEEWARIQLTVSGVLLFATLVGTVYLTAISTRYANAERFASGADALRRYLAAQLSIALPPVYVNFLQRGPAPRGIGRRLAGLVAWLYPTSAYQLFIALTTSAALAAVVWFFLLSTRVVEGTLILTAAGVTFLLTLMICNIYSRLVMRIIIRSMEVALAEERLLPTWMHGN